jgi:hypothetical protein
LRGCGGRFAPNRNTPVAELRQSRLDDPGFELKASLASVLVELHRHPERVQALFGGN